MPDKLCNEKTKFSTMSTGTAVLHTLKGKGSGEYA